MLEKAFIVGSGKVGAVMSAAAFFPGLRRARDQQPRLVHVTRFAAAPHGSGAQTRARVLQAVERVLRPLPLHTTAHVVQHDVPNFADKASTSVQAASPATYGPGKLVRPGRPVHTPYR